MTEHANAPEDLDELVAYLDGELGHDSSQRIEKRMAQDAAFRLRVQELQRAWDLLDLLPRAQAGENFARTTVEMVALQAEQAVHQQVDRKKRRRTLEWVLGGSAVLASMAAGFLITASTLNAPDRQFLSDLPIIERVDQYQWIDSIEFLRMLDEQAVFPEEASDAS